MNDYKKDPTTNPPKGTGSDGVNFTNNGYNNLSPNEPNSETGNTTMTTNGRAAWAQDKSTHT